MEQNNRDPKFAQTPQKKTEMPAERKSQDISGGPSKTQRPEIDLPLKGGRAESDLASTQPKKEVGNDSSRNDTSRSTR